VRSGSIYIGTSGWSYDHWKGPFYPPDLTSRKMLSYYVRAFRSVEINSSFYGLPTKATLESWRRTAPHGFVFSAKASRYITHRKKLKDPEATTGPMFERLAALGESLGPVLFQLPPHWAYNEARLAQFLETLGPQFRYAFEFRDRSWINDRSLALLESHDAAFCIYELGGFVTPEAVTTDFVYIRLHGPAAAYQGSYDAPALERWAGKIADWSDSGLRVHCYFDNDQAGYAVSDARRLIALLGLN